MSNTSIRVECYHVPINKSSSNKKLGYLLLKVKGAQTINPKSNDRVSYNNFRIQYLHRHNMLCNNLLSIQYQ